MVPIAPRYDPLIVKLAYAVDDPRQPMAETCRHVGELAERLGLFRPSYVHLRRFLVEKRRGDTRARDRRRLRRGLAVLVLGGAGAAVVARRRRRAGQAPDFVAQSYKRMPLARELAPD